MGKEIIPMGVDFPTHAVQAIALRDFNRERGERVLSGYGHTPDSPLYKEYLKITSIREVGRDIPAKKKAEFTARFILQTFELLKLKETNVFYIGHTSSPLFRMCRSVEELGSYVSDWYQLFFGFSTDIEMTTKSLISGILSRDHYSEVSRDYIQIMEGYYWGIKTAEITRLGDLPSNTRVFAKMFDTVDEDENIFAVPEFDKNGIDMMLSTYDALKNLSYYDWPDEYHLQCFKDWSINRPHVEFGMFSVIALPFMRPGIMRGSIFNVGMGHNGKSVVLGLAASLIGSRNMTTVSGNNLGSWDFLVDLQTTWFNCPSETDVSFLTDQTDAFKTISAHETYSIRKKHGDASVPVSGNFAMAFNINKIPELGADAPAILSRMFVNNFERDFESEGIAVKDYARQTFLSDKNMMPKLTGMVLAFAHYYSQPEHLWEASPSMKAELEAITEITRPERRYMDWFKKFFVGYAGITLLKNDYLRFGAQEGIDYNGAVISQQELLFRQFKRQSLPTGTIYKLVNEKFPVQRYIFTKDIYIRKYMGSMKYESYRESGASLIYDMMLDYLAKEEEIRKRLKLYGEEKDKKEVEKMVLQQMWKEITEEQGGRPYEWK